jgi:hypothetical protein
VTVRADDIAFVDLGEDAFKAGPSDHARDALDLGRRVTMVEIHYTRRESATAVGTGHVSELTEHVGVPAPARPPPLDPR